MSEIVRITADRQTLYMRLPRAWARRLELRRGDYLMVDELPDNGLTVDTFQGYFDNGKRAKNSKNNRDPGQ